MFVEKDIPCIRTLLCVYIIIHTFLMEIFPFLATVPHSAGSFTQKSSFCARVTLINSKITGTNMMFEKKLV
jgi:hypothetical protein